MPVAQKIGIVGGGQLGWMLARAAQPLGFECQFIDPNALSPAYMAADGLLANYDDQQVLTQLAEQSDFLTYEFENVAVETLESLPGVVNPSPKILAQSQDRLLEKQLCHQLGLPTAPYTGINSPAELERAGQEMGWPLIVKTRRLGYDGKGQGWVRGASEARAMPSFEPNFYIAEGVVGFDFEISIAVAARGRDDMVFYPISRNQHEAGVLLEARPLVQTDDESSQVSQLQQQAEDYARAFIDHFDYRGLLTLEFFVCQGKLLINELAPRVHNSYHWSIEGCQTSQFENHMRAVADLPLGSTQLLQPVMLFNCLGSMPERNLCLEIPGLKYHSYHKEPRNGRKVGHLTLVEPTDKKIAKVREVIRASK